MDITSTTNRAEFIKTFIDKLGNVDNWNHSGIVIDAGKGSNEKCVCGHKIRYLFILEGLNGKTAQVGSECINHFKDYNESLYNSLIATVARIKEEEKKAKEMMLLEEVNKVKTPYEENVKKVWNWYKEVYGNHYCNNYYIWSFVNKTLSLHPNKVYKSVKVLLNWYKKNEVSLSNFIVQYM